MRVSVERPRLDKPFLNRRVKQFALGVPAIAVDPPAIFPTAAVTTEPEPHPDRLRDLEQFMPRDLLAKLESARRSGVSGERRIVTILFCDIRGSTALAEQFDPEEWTEIVNGAFEHMVQPVYKYEGTVARLTGDGLLAFFGAPIAHEDDPRRAVLAGLEIVDGIHRYRQGLPAAAHDFDIRVGINTGLVVVGAIGSDLRLEYSAIGDAINLAARMEQTAAPGTVQMLPGGIWRCGRPLKIVKATRQPQPIFIAKRNKRSTFLCLTCSRTAYAIYSWISRWSAM